jgi:hypothetical protein
VIRRAVGADHARGDVLHAAPLDTSRRALADGVAVEQQRHHHRRLVRGTALPVQAITGIEAAQVQSLDGVDDKPRQVVVGQPLAQARRQQQCLIAITLQEVRAHGPNRLNRPGQTPGLRNSHRATQQLKLPCWVEQ